MPRSLHHHQQLDAWKNVVSGDRNLLSLFDVGIRMSFFQTGTLSAKFKSLSFHLLGQLQQPWWHSGNQGEAYLHLSKSAEACNQVRFTILSRIQITKTNEHFKNQTLLIAQYFSSTNNKTCETCSDYLHIEISFMSNLPLKEIYVSMRMREWNQIIILFFQFQVTLFSIISFSIIGIHTSSTVLLQTPHPIFICSLLLLIIFFNCFCIRLWILRFFGFLWFLRLCLFVNKDTWIIVWNE